MNLKGVTYGNGRYVAVGDRLTIVTSANGMNWDTGRSARCYNYYLRDVTCGNGSFVAVGGFNFVTGSQIFKYLTGRRFSRRGGLGYFLYPGITDQYLNGIAYGNGIFVAVGGEGAMTIFPGRVHLDPG